MDIDKLFETPLREIFNLKIKFYNRLTKRWKKGRIVRFGLASVDVIGVDGITTRIAWEDLEVV